MDRTSESTSRTYYDEFAKKYDDRRGGRDRPARWLPPDGQTILEHEGDRLKLLVDEDSDLSALLAAARAAGEVQRFAYGPPRLSELFMEAVAAPRSEDVTASDSSRHEGVDR